MLRLIAMSIIGLTLVGVTVLADEAEVREVERVSAPILYEDMMLVVTTDMAVAAFIFTDRIERGINYKYRFLSVGATKELTGEGKVFERYRKVVTDGVEQSVYDGGELFIEAGSIKFEWSEGGDDRGWIYYKPERMRVQIAHAKSFKRHAPVGGTTVEKLDLRRFMRK